MPKGKKQKVRLINLNSLKSLTKKISKAGVFKVVFSALAATLFVIVMSFSTSPLYKENYGGDSAQFQTIGKIWANGGVPYRDAFDHKGPVIFFVNSIGYRLTGDKTGIVIIQIVCLFVTILLLFKICELASDKLYYGVIGVILSLIFLSIFYVEGNMTEEYCLPFITWSIYGLAKFFTSLKKSEKTEHSPKWAVIYGICFGVCLMTRVTNAIPVAIGVLTIAILLVVKKKWANLLKNAGYCFVGIMTVVAPFVIYFALQGALGDLYYCTIGFNLEYASRVRSWLEGATRDVFAHMSITLFPSYTLLLAAFLARERGKNTYSIFLALCGALEMIWFCSESFFPQYEMITVPQVALLLNELILQKNSSEARLLQSLVIALIVILCYGQVQAVSKKVTDNYHTFSQPTTEQQDVEYLISTIPETEKNSFVAFGGNELKDVYLRNNLFPHYKYFAIQGWHSLFSENIKNNVHDTFAHGDAKWILADEDKVKIEDILDSRYNIVNERGRYTLYRISE